MGDYPCSCRVQPLGGMMTVKTALRALARRLPRPVKKQINEGIWMLSSAGRQYSMLAKDKWRTDASLLPLTEAHRSLYGTIHKLYFKEFGILPDIVGCQDFNEKIQWLKLFDQDREIVRCCDKVLVRDRVRERVGDEHLVRLYQVGRHFSDLDFDALPDSFVIKANHDNGTVRVVPDKSAIDREDMANWVNSALRRPFGVDKGEWGYGPIERRVLAEEMLPFEDGLPPRDYKFYVVEGRVVFMHLISGRGTYPTEQTVDPSGVEMGLRLHSAFAPGNGFSRPAEWQEMIRVAEAVGAGFKCVRVDLYLSNRRIYVGEMTFWPKSGLYQGEDRKRIGALLDFDRSTFKPLVSMR